MWKEIQMTKAEKLKQGLKEFFTRNLIIIILVRCGITITDQMINGVQGRIGDGIGVPAALIGALTSVLMIVRIVTRAPAGSFTDNGSKRNVLIFGCLVKAIAMLCYGFAGNTVMFAIARVLQGFSGAFLGVAVPAIFGITLKRETMGFAFAIYSAMETLCNNFGRPIGLSIYGALGQKALGITIAVITLCVLALSMLLDFKKIEKELQAVRDAKKQTGKKKSIFDGLLVKALPIAIPIAIPMIVWTADGIYFPCYTDSLGINPTFMLYAAGVIASIMALLTPIISNIIGAKWTSIICYSCRVAACFIIGAAATTGMMTAGVLVNSLGECYDVPLVLLALSIFPKTEFGAFYATMYLMMDISGVIAGFLAGPLASLSYSLMYYVLGGITLAGLISIIFAVKKYSAIANSANKNSEQEG